jgi:hypothetical protein
MAASNPMIIETFYVPIIDVYASAFWKEYKNPEIGTNKSDYSSKLCEKRARINKTLPRPGAAPTIPWGEAHTGFGPHKQRRHAWRRF